MNIIQIQNEIFKLPLAEQTSLLDSLWTKINKNNSLSQEQKLELDIRYQEYQAGKLTTLDWQIAHQHLQKNIANANTLYS